MVTYLLDTNSCIHLMNRTSPRLAERFARCAPEAVAISVVTLAELLFGIERSSQRGLNMEKLVMFRSRVRTLSFSEDAAPQFGLVHAALTRAGKPIGAFDTLIAAHALALGSTLVTDNTREFRRVKGLRLENWLRRTANP